MLKHFFISYRLFWACYTTTRMIPVVIKKYLLTYTNMFLLTSETMKKFYSSQGFVADQLSVERGVNALFEVFKWLYS